MLLRKLLVRLGLGPGLGAKGTWAPGAGGGPGRWGRRGRRGVRAEGVRAGLCGRARARLGGPAAPGPGLVPAGAESPRPPGRTDGVTGTAAARSQGRPQSVSTCGTGQPRGECLPWIRGRRGSWGGAARPDPGERPEPRLCPGHLHGPSRGAAQGAFPPSLWVWPRRWARGAGAGGPGAHRPGCLPPAPAPPWVLGSPPPRCGQVAGPGHVFTGQMWGEGGSHERKCKEQQGR